MSEITDSDFLKFFNIGIKFTKDQIIALFACLQSITNNRYKLIENENYFIIKCIYEDCNFEINCDKSKKSTNFQIIKREHCHPKKNTTKSSDFGQIENELLKHTIKFSRPRKQKKKPIDASNEKKPKKITFNTVDNKEKKIITRTISNEKKNQDASKPIEIVSSKNMNENLLNEKKKELKDNNEQLKETIKDDLFDDKKDCVQEILTTQKLNNSDDYESVYQKGINYMEDIENSINSFKFDNKIIHEIRYDKKQNKQNKEIKEIEEIEENMQTFRFQHQMSKKIRTLSKEDINYIFIDKNMKNNDKMLTSSQKKYISKTILNEYECSIDPTLDYQTMLGLYFSTNESKDSINEEIVNETQSQSINVIKSCKSPKKNEKRKTEKKPKRTTKK